MEAELRSAEVGGLYVTYREAGVGTPLVLLHGFLCDSRCWMPQLSGVSDRFRVVAWDAPGAGASSDPPDAFTTTDYARCLAGFLDTITVRPGQRLLDVCAGTNAIGIGLLEREPRLEVHAIDRSNAMQEVGGREARQRGFRIHSVIGDVHELPFPDNHFDVVTLQFASRHLRVKRVFSEILRVLKPGGHFHHCDMLKPANPLVESVYYAYLKFCLTFTAVVFQSGPAALNCRKYFIDALQMFYSAQELATVLRELGFRDVYFKTVLAGMLAFHTAAKPIPAS